MPRYFFDVEAEDGVSTIDEAGHELPNEDAAIREAVRSLPSIAAHEASAKGDPYRYMITVRDETGRAVYTAALSFCGV